MILHSQISHSQILLFLDNLTFTVLYCMFFLWCCFSHGLKMKFLLWFFKLFRWISGICLYFVMKVGGYFVLQSINVRLEITSWTISLVNNQWLVNVMEERSSIGIQSVDPWKRGLVFIFKLNIRTNKNKVIASWNMKE